MPEQRPPFVCIKQETWCAEAAQRDPQAAAFLLDRHILLDDRFELAARILCPGQETARSVH
jgi:hypothetical protein